MVNPKRNKAGQFVKGSRRAKPAAKARHVTKKRAKPRAAAAKKTTRHIVIDMGGRHEFKASSAPHIAVSYVNSDGTAGGSKFIHSDADGKAMFFAGGKYRVTERGITDI